MPQAEIECIKQGGNLASYHNGPETTFVNSLIKRVTGKALTSWCGRTDAIKDGTFFNTDGSPMNFKNWARGEPNGRGKESCVQMYHTGHFNDVGCGAKLPFVCSKHL
ncbi:galactose-specific lectin nattectin-like [Genypterus blacodes]|uniref:galactose-specific lectin nattectin-like n=1 Tax=Genypterus blacodes TaxID=154954 RepID=UPI003F76EE50